VIVMVFVLVRRRGGVSGGGAAESGVDNKGVELN